MRKITLFSGRWSYPGLLGLLILLIGFSPQGWGQTYSDSHSDAYVGGPYSVTNGGSDYTVSIGWTTAFRATNQGYCDCHTNTEDLEFGTTQGENNRTPVWSTSNAADNNGNTGDIILGPGYSDTWYIYTEADGDDDALFSCWVDCDARAWSGGGLWVRTAPFKNPSSFVASSTEGEGSRLNKVVLSWGKATHFPEGYTQYVIYRRVAGVGNYAHLVTLGGDARSYEDLQVSPNTTYDYKITTYSSYSQRLASAGTDVGEILKVAATAGWGNLESTGSYDQGQTLTVNLDASDGTYKTKVTLSWNKVSTSADNMKVERSLPGSNPIKFEELAILNKHATAYTDTDALPGFQYTYRVSPLDENGDPLQEVDNPGHMKANGIVRGTVRALGGAGVQGISVCVLPLNPVVPAGVNTVPAAGYCTTTDAGGNYEIRNIYYYDSASFVVVPSYPNHVFGPPSRVLVLDLTTNIQPGVDFTDSTSISIFGRVHFPPASDFGASGANLIGIRKAKVLLDTLDRGIRTDGDGNWSYAVTNPGVFKFSVQYETHGFKADPLFADATGDTAVVTILDQDVNGVDFIDQQKDSVLIRVQDGCGNPLAVTPNGNGSTPRVKVTSQKGPTYFEKYVSMSNTGFAKVVLPAADFQINALDDPPFTNGNIAVQLMDTTLKYELATRDSSLQVTSDTTLDITPSRVVVINGTSVTLPPDTVFNITRDSMYRSIQPRANFVYYGPFLITVNFEDAGAEVYPGCKATGLGTSADSIILMEVGARYGIQFEIFDQFSGCAVDTGQVLVYDYISDQERTPSTLPIKNGVAFYTIEGGEPNVASGGANPYQKLFFASVSAGVREAQDKGWWILLQGAKELTPTFTSRSPEIPDLVIHDPPGDNSYAWVEKGSVYSSFSTTEREISGSGGLYGDMIIGGKGKSALGLGVATLFDVGAGAKIVFDYDIGRENFDKAGYRSTYSFEENFSTSSDPLFTGHEGDVYVGKATNQLWSVAKVLEFDPSSCSSTVQDKPNLEAGGIATTFIYTEKHIKNVLVPQLTYLANILSDEADDETNPTRESELRSESDSFRIDVFNWGQILAKNALNRDMNATYVRNKSFSAGASYELVESYNDEASNSYEYVTFVDEKLKLGVAWEIEGNGLWTEGDAGFAAWFRGSTRKESGNDSTKNFVVGYQLADKDIGDFFSVDILKDTAYNVPAFRIFGGTSSCPQEDGTQARDRANLNIFPPRLDNVPKGGTATFTAQMINESESQEAREYQMRVIPQTNPGGAVITMGGENIGSRSVSYFLDAFQSTEVDLTVQAGPRAANYQDIAIMMYPPCEYELWENNGNLINGDTFYITVNFESECSNVALINPTDNWLVNANNNNILVTDFSGYDLNNPFLESVTLEYQPKNQGWLDGPTIYKSQNDDIFTPTDSLDDLIFREFWDVSGLADGQYKIRARANCIAGKGKTVSSALDGIIDRNSIAPFGIPTPSDGFLRFGQLISVKFDKDIDCGFDDPVPTYPAQITLMRTDDSTFIPLNIQCSENEDQINLVPTIDLFSMPELEDVILVARVQGIQDAQGNTQTYPVEWAFKVNASPVSWDPDSMDLAFSAGIPHTFTSKLKNTAGLSKAFSLASYPTWLTPSILSGSILSDGEYEITFHVSPDLPIGVYRDTVVAMIDGWPEFLDITYEAVAVPPNWEVRAEKYIYSMSMILAFSLDQSDTNLSRDERDMVAAVYNGEIRGVAQLQYVSQFNKYMAFLTVYSDIPANEEISFSMWRASTGVEHVAKETFFFNSEHVYGLINNPEILHTDGVYQVIPLTQGWNWVSLNITNTDMTIDNLLNSLGSPDVGNDVTVKRKDGATATFTQIATPIIYANQWAGNLAQLDNKQAYLIHLSDAPDTLRIPGKPVTAFDNIDVLSGWNWIGFQPQSAQAIKPALSSINLRNLDLAKGQEAFSQYHKGSKTWFGSLQFLEPGKGYKLKLKDGVNYNDLVYSRLGLKDFEVDPTRFESSMTLIASVGKLAVGSRQLAGGSTLPTEDWILQTENRLLVGAFIEDSCRGFGYVEYVEFLKEYRVIFSLHGNSTDVGKAVTFKVYDTQSGQEFIPANEPEIYISDRILGSMLEPYVLFEKLELPEAGYYLEQNYPNPYDSKTSIRFILPEQGKVKLSVYDSFGKLMQVLVDEELSAGEHTAIFDGSKLPGGVYHYSLEAGEFRASRKMVKF